MAPNDPLRPRPQGVAGTWPPRGAAQRSPAIFHQRDGVSQSSALRFKLEKFLSYVRNIGEGSRSAL
jgi:hypothetical protein